MAACCDGAGCTGWKELPTPTDCKLAVEPRDLGRRGPCDEAVDAERDKGKGRSEVDCLDLVAMLSVRQFRVRLTTMGHGDKRS